MKSLIFKKSKILFSSLFATVLVLATNASSVFASADTISQNAADGEWFNYILPVCLVAISVIIICEIATAIIRKQNERKFNNLEKSSTTKLQTTR